jgi:endonuclease YncB( thermonuclease family)
MRNILLVLLCHLIAAMTTTMTATMIATGAAAETLSGRVKVIDATNMRVGKQLVRLYGIAAPKASDRCPLRSVTIKCGRIRGMQDPWQARRQGDLSGDLQGRGL